MEQWWNEGKTEELGEKYSSATSSTTSLTGLNPSLRGKKPAISRLRRVTAYKSTMAINLISINVCLRNYKQLLSQQQRSVKKIKP
jgi:hypothetical protein